MDGILQVTMKKLLAPITPSNIYCIGLNYREHAVESGMEPPTQPVVFAKPTSAVCGPGDQIVLPACCHEGPEVDYECELAVVIGKTAKYVSEAEALVAGGADALGVTWGVSGAFATECP